MSVPVHIPVLANEVMQWLAPREGQTFVDGTLGGGGHTRLLAEKVGASGQVISFDADAAALAAAEKNLSGLPVKIVHANFREIPAVLRQLNLAAVDGVLLDLGLSSDQLADDARGFSFDSTGELDLRFNLEEGEPAWRLLQRMREAELADLIFEFGEERLSRRVARAIVEARQRAPVRTAAQVAAIVRRIVPRSKVERIDPATRTFQALRIAVNRELESLDSALRDLPNCLLPGGRLAVISFHSLEDRRVKQAFREDSRWESLTKKPVIATAEEQHTNPRSRSAKLRVAKKANSDL